MQAKFNHKSENNIRLRVQSLGKVKNRTPKNKLRIIIHRREKKRPSEQSACSKIHSISNLKDSNDCLGRLDHLGNFDNDQ